MGEATRRTTLQHRDAKPHGPGNDSSAEATRMTDSHDLPERRRRVPNFRVERRRRSAAPWIVGAVSVLIVAAVLWPDPAGQNGVRYAMSDADGAVVTDSELRAADTEAAVGDYVRFVGSQPARNVIGPKHQYTADGIRRLATAISALARLDTVAGSALMPRIQALGEQADALQRDPSADTHALKTREAFVLAASILESLQQARFPELDGDAAAVLRAAEGVSARTALTAQADAVERFFERTAHLLQGMRSGDI
jgi:hypothetical protein